MVAPAFTAIAETSKNDKTIAFMVLPLISLLKGVVNSFLLLRKSKQVKDFQTKLQNGCYILFITFFARSEKKPRLITKKTAIISTPVRMPLVRLFINPNMASPQTVASFSMTS